MIDEHQVIDALRSNPAGDGLDPDRVIAGARRRRTRNRISAVAAAAAIGVVAVAMVSSTGVVNSSDPAPATSPQKTPSPTPLSTGTKQPWPAVQGTAPVDWVPLGLVGPKPIGRIPRGRWVELMNNIWFVTTGTSWCLSNTSGTPTEVPKPSECIGTVGNRNLVKGTIGMPGSNRQVISVYEGELRRVVYTIDNRYIEAKLYRMDAVPGWTVAAGQLPGDVMGALESVFAYDKRGKLVAKLTKVEMGTAPLNDPLHPR